LRIVTKEIGRNQREREITKEEEKNLLMSYRIQGRRKNIREEKRGIIASVMNLVAA
jgi:hypothetical protein